MTELVFCEKPRRRAENGQGHAAGHRAARRALYAVRGRHPNQRRVRKGVAGAGVPGTAGEVACLALGLSMGDISGLPGHDAARRIYRCWRNTAVCRTRCRECARKHAHRAPLPWTPWPRRPRRSRGMCAYGLAPRRMRRAALFACSLLRHAPCRVSAVVLGGLYTGPQGTLVQLSSGGEASPEALGGFLKEERPLDAPLLGTLPGMWEALKHENAPLRAIVNGRLMSVPEHFYDTWLLRAIPRTGSFRAAVPVGRALAAVPGVGDAVFIRRMRAMLARRGAAHGAARRRRPFLRSRAGRAGRGKAVRRRLRQRAAGRHGSQSLRRMQILHEACRANTPRQGRAAHGVRAGRAFDTKPLQRYVN